MTKQDGHRVIISSRGKMWILTVTSTAIKLNRGTHSGTSKILYSKRLFYTVLKFTELWKIKHYSY